MARINRRQWKRHEKSDQVLVSTSLAVGERPADVSNFSKGGLCLLTRQKMAVGSSVIVRLGFMLAGLARDVRAKVKWCVPSGSGYAVGVEYDEPLHWARYE